MCETAAEQMAKSVILTSATAAPGSILGPAARANLHTFRYRGTDHSLLYKYLLSPWAEYCVQRLTPLWVA